MRYNIENMVFWLLNTAVILVGLLTFGILMVTTGSVLITTVITIIVTLGTIPIMTIINNKVDYYLSEYWVEAHKQGKERERDEVVKVIGWNFQHKVFETEVDSYDINGEKDTITISELIREELKNHPVTNQY